MARLVAKTLRVCSGLWYTSLKMTLRFGKHFCCCAAIAAPECLNTAPEDANAATEDANAATENTNAATENTNAAHGRRKRSYGKHKCSSRKSYVNTAYGKTKWDTYINRIKKIVNIDTLPYERWSQLNANGRRKVPNGTRSMGR